MGEPLNLNISASDLASREEKHPPSLLDLHLHSSTSPRVRTSIQLDLLLLPPQIHVNSALITSSQHSPSSESFFACKSHSYLHIPYTQCPHQAPSCAPRARLSARNSSTHKLQALSGRAGTLDLGLVVMEVRGRDGRVRLRLRRLRRAGSGGCGIARLD